MNSQNSPQAGAPRDGGFSPWQRLKTKNISYLTIPLLVMATVVEFVILATGWKYQQTVCLPQGMGVTFFGIGPIGATILAVELLKLPLAIWTASRHGWQKGFMIMVGLPLICILTFQLVKDMAVYEMGVAMTPASQMLEKAAAEETKISQLNGELAGIEEKRADRERKFAALATKQAKAKAELEESVKRNEAARQDAISLTDYQKKELSEVEARQATIIQQFATDTEQLTKAITDLRARRDAEFARSAKDSASWESRKTAYDAALAKWQTEEARIDNAFQSASSKYANTKSAYEKDKAEYAAANFLKRQLLLTPVDPGVPPVREVNKIPKPADLDGRPSALVAEIDALIKAKEAELLAVNNKRRDRIAQVDTDARRLREEFDHRSGAKREESDRKREELTAALATLAKQGQAETDNINKEFETVVQKVDSIRSEVDAARKRAEGFYEAREAAIRKTQVHRIATTVEIVRGLIKGERPMSIKATAKERGDILTDQISMVRIWVYPVLAFIVAFLPTLMVEIGFSTVFQPPQLRQAHRLGFFGRRMHELYTRAGRFKILRAERIASAASAEIAARDRALTSAKAAASITLAEKDEQLQAAREAIASASADREAQFNRMEADRESQLKRMEAEYEAQASTKEAAWVAKLAGLADSLNRTVVEKDSLRDLQKSEIERQIQMRQNAWSDRLTQMRQELDDQRSAAETERTTMMQEHQTKLMEISENCKTQVIEARRQKADAELAAVEKTAKMAHDLKEALHTRDAAETQLKHQSDSLTLKLTQAKEDAGREIEKAARHEKHRFERQQLEYEKALRQRDEDYAHQVSQREQESSLAFEARLAEEKTKVEQAGRVREAELERQIETRAREVDTRWSQEVQQREDAAQIRLKQREQQMQALAETRLRDMQAQADEQFRRRESELERQLDAKTREADTRLKQELQQKEIAFQAKLNQREQESTLKASTRETELQTQWASDLRVRMEEWERQAEARVRATETRLGQEAQQKEELTQSKLRQRDQQWQVKLDTARLEMQQKEEAFQIKAKQREQELVAQLTAQAADRHLTAQAQWETESEKKTRAAVEPYKALLARTEKERDEAKQSAAATARQMQEMEKKLSEVSSFLNPWRNGRTPVEGLDEKVGDRNT